MTESQIEKKLVAYCRKRGIYTRKFVSPANRGVPDRVIVGNGRVLFLELKREGNKPTELQKWGLAQLREHGAEAHLATGYDEAKAIVDAIILSTSRDCL